jgi:hypothetical protein
MAENSCKCGTTTTTNCNCYYGTGGGGASSMTGGIEITSNGTWTTGGWWNPSYTYNTAGYHAPKCENCGYCKCCGKADIPGNVTGEAKPDFIGK